MVTDPPPRGAAALAEYRRSDALATVPLPPDDRLHVAAAAIEPALAAEDRPAVRRASAAFLDVAAAHFGVPAPGVRILAARPLRVYEHSTSELFGDYDLGTAVIRVWMRTAVQRRVTSFGTLISTLCHELCHHLDLVLLDLPSTYHTRGFYERTARLYHAARGTPLKPLAWMRRADGGWQIDWRRMRSSTRQS